jgi:hypothetical protein
MQIWDDDGESELHFTGTHKTSGSITSNRGVCKVKLNTTVSGNANLENANRRITASENNSVSINNTTLTVSGTSQSSGSFEIR